MIVYNCDDCQNDLQEQEEKHLEILAEIFRLIEELKKVTKEEP